MAVVLVPRLRVGNWDITFWMDPHRYRAMVWERDGGPLIKCMVDKDCDRLRKRLFQWLETSYGGQ